MGERLHLWLWVFVFLLGSAIYVMGDEIQTANGEFVRFTVCTRAGQPHYNAWIRKGLVGMILEGSEHEELDKVHKDCSLVYMTTQARITLIGTPREILERLK